MVRLLAPVLCFYAVCGAASAPNPQQQLLSPAHYQAPLLECDGELVKGRYIVSLKPGHTFQDYFRGIGKDGTDPNDFDVDVDLMAGLFLPNAIAYRCGAVSEQTFGDIRGDKGVEEIYHVPFQAYSALYD